MHYPPSPFRILPVTVAMCCLMMVVKTVALLQGHDQWEEVLAPAAVAEESAPEAKAEGDAEADKGKAQEDSEATAEEKKTEKKSDTTSSDKKKNADKEGGEKAKANPPPEEIAEKCRFNQIEVDLLQSLSARRQEIEKWAEDVKMQANVLKATEMQIDTKITQMQKLQKEVQELITKYDSKANIEMQSLVKIYENMKPKSAAGIFNEMEMGILLDLVDMMSERKASPILANMDPKKARDVTMELAEKRKLRQEVTQGVEGVEGQQEEAQPSPALN